MLKNKLNINRSSFKRRLLALAAAAGLVFGLLSFTSGSVYASELIPERDIREDSASYVTKNVEYGDLQETSIMGSVEYYPISKKVIYFGPDAVYTGLAAAGRAGEIKEGDPIIKIKVKVDEVAVTEKELQLLRLQESYNKGVSDRTDAVNDLIKARDKQSDSLEVQKLNIRIRIAQIQLEQYQYTQQKSIKKLQDELEEFYGYREETTIDAPIGGNLSQMLYINEGDLITSGTVICTITDPSIRMLRTDGRALPYGLSVTAEFSSAQNLYKVPGKVVVSTSLAPSLSNQPFSQIEVEEDENTKGVSFRSPRIEALNLELKNVLLVPNSAKELDQGNIYVTVLGEDNQPHKRYIQVGVTGNKDTWVLNGLSEGEKVIIK